MPFVSKQWFLLAELTNTACANVSTAVYRHRVDSYPQKLYHLPVRGWYYIVELLLRPAPRYGRMSAVAWVLGNAVTTTTVVGLDIPH